MKKCIRVAPIAEGWRQIVNPMGQTAYYRDPGQWAHELLTTAATYQGEGHMGNDSQLPK
jgi:hypothetical protein